MKRKQLARGLFGLALAGALSVGAADALAAPAARQQEPFCTADLCDRACKAIGAFGGTCVNGGCACWL